MSLIQRIGELSQPLEPIATDVTEKLSPLNDIRAVLFDVYGTLIISGSGDIGISMAQDSASAFAAALKAVELSAESIDPQQGFARLHEAIQRHHAVRRTAGIEYPEVEIRDVWAEVLTAMGLTQLSPDTVEAMAVEYECRVNPTWPMPDLLSTLTALRERDLTLGIVSNAQFFTPLLFEALADHDLVQLGFDLEQCVYSFELLEAKPSTVLYEQAADRLRDHRGIRPEQVLYVGNDMLNDITPAQQVGFKTALFAGDQRSLRLRLGDPRVVRTQPDLIVTTLASLPPLLSP
ncbi:HAD family hydrolase [Planctomycetales bacterium ZRK34]|nr:HAD family hydrolase [Planctomycetales bacterium ZRK34]